MGYRPNDQFGYYGHLLNLDGSPQSPPPTVRQQQDAVDTWRVPRSAPPRPLPTRQPFEMPQRRPIRRYEEPEHREVVQPSPASRRAGSSVPRPPAPGPKPEAAMPKAPEHPAQSKLHIAKGMTTTPEGRLDPAKFPELTWPWRWAYVPSTTTTNPAAKVLVPINQETQQIHASYYNRFPPAVTDTPVPTTDGSASRDLPIGCGVGQLQSISVGETAASAYQSDPTRATNVAANNKKDLPGKKAHLPYGDESSILHPTIESFEEAYNYLFNPSSISKPRSPLGPRYPPGKGTSVYCPPHEKDPDVSAPLSARMESLRRDRQQACSDKELDELVAKMEQKGQTSVDLLKVLKSMHTNVTMDMNLQVRQLAAQKAEDAQRSARTPSAKGVAPIHLNVTVQEINPAQTTSKVADGGMEELRKRAGIPIVTGATPPRFTTENKISAQAASNTKRERWLAIDKPKTSQEKKSQEEFVELSLESDEEGWEKVDGDDEWEVIDDPRVEVERKANLQSKH